MLGRSLLVAPVLQEGVLGRRVYLPQGCWFTASTGMPAAPGWHDCPCGWQEIPVFVRGETDDVGVGHRARNGLAGHQPDEVSRVDHQDRARIRGAILLDKGRRGKPVLSLAAFSGDSPAARTRQRNVPEGCYPLKIPGGVFI